MELWHKLLIGVSILLIVVCGIVYINNIDKSDEDEIVEDFDVTEAIEIGNCFKLKDGRTVCKLKSNVSIAPGSIEEEDFGIEE